MAATHATTPGSFAFGESSLPPKLDLGAKSLFFQPPKTPSASTSLKNSTASLTSHDLDNTRSRKRSRYEAYEYSARTSTQSHAWSVASSVTPNLDVSGSTSPQPFVNTQYELAGGIDTPTAAGSSAIDQSPHSAFLAHGGRGFRALDVPPDGYFPDCPSALAREANGRSRMPVSPGLRDGLGRVVYNFVGAAGKLLEFCKTAAFKGFYAGGGQGYELRPPDLITNGAASVWEDADHRNMFHGSEWDISIVPGRFPDEDFYPEYLSEDHTKSSRPSKKVQRENGLGSWVVVGHEPASREASPSRLAHRKTPSSVASARRPAPRLGRRPILPASRSSLTSCAGSPGLHVNRPASYASPRSPARSPVHQISPVSVEVQQHAARIRRREIEEEANLKRMNLQIKAMLRQGKEALGTKFEVEMEDEKPFDGE